MTRIVPALALPLVIGACAATHEDAHDPLQRQRLLDSVKALAGTWESKSHDGGLQVTEFKVSSAGSVVREIMFPDTPHEMTNVYCLDGNALAMTHYCAMGNQPHLRAAARVGNQLEFGLVDVADKDSADEEYMGGLTLEFVDQDHLTEHWRSYVKGELQTGHSIDIALTRRK
jgi:hypothetical protein